MPDMDGSENNRKVVVRKRRKEGRERNVELKRKKRQRREASMKHTYSVLTS